METVFGAEYLRRNFCIHSVFGRRKFIEYELWWHNHKLVKKYLHSGKLIVTKNVSQIFVCVKEKKNEFFAMNRRRVNGQSP